jgi:uncharacterized protein (TIGR02118 family)
MIQVSVLYPQGDGKHFDMAYYLGNHIPMVKAKLGAACKAVTVVEGLAGGAPGSKPAYAAMCHLSFDSPDAFKAAFAPHAAAILGDIPNYTDIEPVIQVSAIKA